MRQQLLRMRERQVRARHIRRRQATGVARAPRRQPRLPTQGRRGSVTGALRMPRGPLHRRARATVPTSACVQCCLPMHHARAA